MSPALLAALLLAGEPADAPGARSVPAAEARPAARGAPAPNAIPAPGATPAPTAAGAQGSASPAPPPQPVVIVPVPAELPVSRGAPARAGAAPLGAEAAARQRLRLGDQLLAEGDRRMALFAYQEAAYQDPRSAEARLKLGRLYLLLDHPDEAEEQLGVAAALAPGLAEAREALERLRARRRGDVPPPGSPIVARLPGGEVAPGSEVPPAAPTAAP